jgi:RHS repeat-associated protein
VPRHGLRKHEGKAFSCRLMESAPFENRERCGSLILSGPSREIKGGPAPNGNLTNDTFNAYTWDADGNITTVKGTVTNTYDAFDQLVETSVGPTQFLYLPGGTQPFATMSKYNSYLKVFAPAPGGAMIITPNGTYGVLAYHRHTDWLGSSRFATTPSETVYFDGAYAPFGEPYATSGTTDLVFGGNAQDASVVEGATAGDAYDTLNRKYSASQSRWISPDPSGLSAVDPTNPQSWNRYAYVLNNPLSNIDPLGLDCIYMGSYVNGATSQYTDENGNQISVVSGDCLSDTDDGYYVDGTIVGGAFGITLSVDGGMANFYLQGNDEYQAICVAGDCSANTGGVDNSYLPLGSMGLLGANNGYIVVNGNYLFPSNIDNKYNLMEKGQSNYRDLNPLCSTHATVDQTTGQTQSHVDLFNPSVPLPAYYPVDVSGASIPLHLIFDALPDAIYRATGMYLIPAGRTACQ